MIQYQNRRCPGRKGNELSVEEKRVFINIFENGTSITEIGRFLRRPHCTVSTFIRRFLLRGELENHRRSDRSKTIAPRDYRKVERLVKANRRDTLSEVTLKFNENNVKCSIIYMKMVLNKESREKNW